MSPKQLFIEAVNRRNLAEQAKEAAACTWLKPSARLQCLQCITVHNLAAGMLISAAQGKPLIDEPDGNMFA